MYNYLNESKEKCTPIVSVKRIRNSKSTIKYKRLTKILDYYSNKLLTTGRTPYLDRKLNETRNALVDEGNVAENDFSQGQQVTISPIYDLRVYKS